jgi:hypothetical protein
MNQEELIQNWKRTRGFLDAATKLLPQSIEQTDERLIRYYEWLEHNELELALAELKNIGEDVSVPKQFWEELEKAARNMGLIERLDIVCATCGKRLATHNTSTDKHSPSPEQLLLSGAVPVPNFGWFCSQTCGNEFEKRNGQILFQRDTDGNIRYYP